MRKFFQRLWGNEFAQDVIEYVLLLILIALAITVGMTVLAMGVNSS